MNNFKSYVIRFLVKVSALITFGALFFIIGYILYRGVPSLRPSLFEFKYTTTNVSMFPSIVTTLMLVFSTLILVTPIGVFTGLNMPIGEISL